MASFRLHLLPLLALEEVLGNLKFFELLKYSILSKLTKYHASRLKKSYLMRVHVSSFSLNIVVNETERYMLSAKQNKQIDEKPSNGKWNGRRVFFTGEKMNAEKRIVIGTYWEDNCKGLVEMAQHVKDVFKNALFSLSSIETCPLSRPFVEWVSKTEFSRRGAGCPICLIRCDRCKMSHEDFKLVLDSIKNLEACYLVSPPLSDFQYDFHGFGNFRHLALYMAPWLRFDHLWSLRNSARVLSLGRTSITSSDVNTFLKSWTNDSMETKLREVRLFGKEEFRLEQVLEGIRSLKMSPGESYPFEKHDNTIRHLERGIKIHRPNGMIVFIECHRIHLYLYFFNFAPGEDPLNVSNKF